MNIIEVDEVTKIYPSRMGKRGVVALDNVSLNVNEGEIFGLLGPNGAGKTTLMKTLLGIVQATRGRCTVAGLPARDPQARRKVGYLPENHRFPTHLTGRGLLQLAGRMCRMESSEIEGRCEKLVPLVGMDRWTTTKVRKYSKGMTQRIGLAQAIISDPELVFLDEPTDGVDPVGKIEIRDILTQLRNEGKTIFLNSHLLSEVESVADRVAILSRGRVVRVDSVEALTRKHHQFEIEADLGNEFLEIPPEMGKRIAISSKGMLIELLNEEDINHIIDQLRLRKIKIRAVMPKKMSLEQSFFEAISADKQSAGGGRA